MKNKILRKQLESEKWIQAAKKLWIASQLVTSLFTLNGDTICQSSRYDIGTWAVVNIENHYSYPSVVKYTCRAGVYCHKVKSSKHNTLKMNIVRNGSSGKELYTDSIEVKYNHAYGFFLERDMEQIQKSSDSDIDITNQKCENGVCMFSYKKNNGVCKRGTLGDECFIEPQERFFLNHFWPFWDVFAHIGAFFTHMYLFSAKFLQILQA